VSLLGASTFGCATPIPMGATASNDQHRDPLAALPVHTLGEELVAARDRLKSHPEAVDEILGTIMRLLTLAQAPTLREEFLSVQALAKFLGVSRQTVHTMNVDGKIPEPLAMGGPKWWSTEIRAWAAAGGPPRNVWAKRREAWLRAALRA
jgi:predicted DNA-binding transcriptional regulator AlpA